MQDLQVWVLIILEATTVGNTFFLLFVLALYTGCISQEKSHLRENLLKDNVKKCVSRILIKKKISIITSLLYEPHLEASLPMQRIFFPSFSYQMQPG